MRTPLSEITAQDAHLLRILVSTKWVNYAFLALALYEYIITIDVERNLLWDRDRKWSISSWFFFLSRYMMIIISLAEALSDDELIVRLTCEDHRCNLALRVLEIAIQVASYLLASAFPALRVYALLRDTRFATIFSAAVFLFGCAPMIDTFYKTTYNARYTERKTILGTVCAVKKIKHFDNLAAVRFALICRTMVIVSDIITIAVTWFKTFSQAKGFASLCLPMGVSGIFIRDGSIYFIGLIASNVFVLFFESADLPGHAPTPFSPNIIKYILPLIFTSRFVANLGQVSSKGSSTHWSSSVMGSMGEPLDFGAHRNVDEEGFDIEPASVFDPLRPLNPSLDDEPVRGYDHV